MFFPPACISVLSWSKRCPVSAAPSRKTILYSPSLNLSTSFPAVPVSSGAAVKTSSAPPCRPPSRSFGGTGSSKIDYVLLLCASCPSAPAILLGPSLDVHGDSSRTFCVLRSPAAIWYRSHIRHANGTERNFEPWACCRAVAGKPVGIAFHKPCLGSSAFEDSQFTGCRRTARPPAQKPQSRGFLLRFGGMCIIARRQGKGPRRDVLRPRRYL
jgi:hypothetical protein